MHQMIRVKQVKYPDQYRMIEDPGHGWLEVDISELVSLGIADKVSSYSYQNGPTVYLEEDCDLSLFLGAKKTPVEYERVYQENTFVRDLPHYQAVRS